MSSAFRELQDACAQGQLTGLRPVFLPSHWVNKKDVGPTAVRVQPMRTALGHKVFLGKPGKEIRVVRDEKGCDQRFEKHIPALSESVADEFYLRLSALRQGPCSSCNVRDGKNCTLPTVRTLSQVMEYFLKTTLWNMLNFCL